MQQSLVVPRPASESRRACRAAALALMLQVSSARPALLLALFHGRDMTLHATVSSGCRDPLRQPFAPTSIWNTPLGSAAQFAPTGMGHFEAAEFHVDGNFVCRILAFLCRCFTPGVL